METKKQQWYMREDYRPETVEGKNFGPFLRELQKIGNLFDSPEECTDFCNSIRRHLGLNELVVAKRDNTPAEETVVYQKEHQMPPGYSPGEIIKYKKKHATPILKELKEKLLAIQKKKSTLPKSLLGKAVNYTLKEYPALSNYLLSSEYELDNNAIERINRYICLSRRNSLFCGSHQGAKRTALIYSLACSCRMNNINTFEYFKDLLSKAAALNPNTDKKVWRELLPDKWKR